MNIKQSYREAAVQGATPVELVVRMYEQLIEDLRQAVIAVVEKDIQRRSNRIKHAILVIGHLQSSLDFAQGGKVAQNLNTFYDTMRQNLVQVQFFPSTQALQQQITDLQLLRQAWIQVDQARRSPVAPALAAGSIAPRSFPSSAGETDESDRPQMNWQV